MVLIPYTNIVVDDFSAARQRPHTRLIHFLTHMHTDHFNGLSDSWNLGFIYCSKITAQLLAFKFPKLSQLIRPLETGVTHQIALCEQTQNLKIDVTLLDANHCAGAVMFLFEGYMGTILHTGDIRFELQKFGQHYALYPSNCRNPKFEACSKQIDVLYLDNTFCDPVFQFPPRTEALKQIVDFVQKAGKRRIYIGLDNIGKQEILLQLAKTFHTLVVVDGNRYKNIILMELEQNYFTTNVSEGWIQVVPKKQLKYYLKNDKTALGIVPTGWSNTPSYHEPTRTFFAPYSLHSNFNELDSFVKSICPSSIIPIVRSSSKKEIIQSEYATQKQAWNSIYRMASIQQTGLTLLKGYTSGFSQSRQLIMSDLILQKAINKKLSLTPNQQHQQEQHCNKIRQQRDIDRVKRLSRKGAKLNIQICQQQIEQSRNMIKEARLNKLLQKTPIVNIPDDQDCGSQEAQEGFVNKKIHKPDEQIVVIDRTQATLPTKECKEEVVQVIRVRSWPLPQKPKPLYSNTSQALLDDFFLRKL